MVTMRKFEGDPEAGLLSLIARKRGGNNMSNAIKVIAILLFALILFMITNNSETLMFAFLILLCLEEKD